MKDLQTYHSLDRHEGTPTTANSLQKKLMMVHSLQRKPNIAHLQKRKDLTIPLHAIDEIPSPDRLSKVVTDGGRPGLVAQLVPTEQPRDSYDCQMNSAGADPSQAMPSVQQIKGKC